jgi:hypothetical protein
METDSVYGRLIDRGPIDKIIFKDGDLDQGLLMNMDMEYLLFSWRLKRTVCYLKECGTNGRRLV